MRTKFSSVVVVLALSLGTVSALAGVTNDIPSCYAANKMSRAAPAPELELFVLIDQTTLLDSKLQESVRENVRHLLKPGVAFVIAGFSAFTQGRYMEVVSTGHLELPIPSKERDDISVKTMKSFDACVRGQLRYGQKLALEVIDKVFGGSSASITKSDIMASLKEMASRINQSSARKKIVFVVSDMLENSSVSSFYSSRNVRMIDPPKEIGLAEAAKLFADFGGAEIFVLGAGVLPEDVSHAKRGKGPYRDPQIMAALKRFWEEYFSRSNASLVEFGMPALTSAVK
jgi:hypothetical protein